MIVKRAGYGMGGRRLMINDNPAWPGAPLPEDAEIVGRVVCLERGANRRARFRTGLDATRPL